MDRFRRGDSRAELAPAHAHLVGIAGRGMSGLAQMLVQRGMLVTGSERAASPAAERLRRLGARAHAGHWPRGTQLLVYGPEIGRDHPARLAATRRGIAQATVGRCLGLLIRQSIGLAVIGQRDAAIASAMIGWTLTRAGLDPTVVLGTSAPQLGGWARLGCGPHFVAEAIAETEQLGALAPRVGVLLDVGPARGIDHANRLSEVRRFARSVPPDGYVVALDRNEIVAEAVREAEATVEWISLERGSSWWGADLREDRGRYRFRAFHRGRFALEVRLQVPGRRNVLSALAAVAACDRLAVPPAEIKQGLEEFAGLSRDFESRGSYRGVTLVDDAGGDPSSVFEALAIARQVFGPRRIWAVYRAGDERVSAEDEPGFHAAFAAADQVLVAGGSRVGSCEAGSDPLVRALVSAGVRARAVAGLEEAISELDRNLEPGDVLVTLGSGEVGTIADAFIRRLPRDRQGR